MAIIIENLRIQPYTQKNTIKPVFGDTMTLTFALPDYQQGDRYILGLDYERVLIPTAREVCALTEEFSISGNNITFNLLISTARFRDWVSSIKKPMPIWLQIQRVRGGIYETILLDDVLALPSVIDGNNTVFHGDPLSDLLDAKLDKPEAEGETGNILTLGNDGKTVWGSATSVDWNDIESKPDFSTVAYTGAYNDLSGKPTLATVATTGNYNDLTGKPVYAKVASTGDYNDLSNTPALAVVASTGDYNDLSNKPSLATVASTGNYNDLENKPEIPTINNATVTFIQGGISKGTINLNQAENSTITLDAGGVESINWDDIESKPDFAQVAYTGSYNDLESKPDLATVASTGDYNDLSSKPDLATVASTGAYNDLTGKPELATVASTGNYADLTGTPTLATVASTGNYNDLSSKPALATVATTGNYNDLTSKPIYATVATTGNYNDLTSKPTIPIINNATISILQGGVTKGVFTLNQATDSTILLGDVWAYIEAGTITSDTITATPTQTVVKQYAVSTAVAIEAGTASSGNVEYAEIVLDVESGASVQAGSNITLADAITDGKRNTCVVRWYAGNATLYVIDTSDIPTPSRNVATPQNLGDLTGVLNNGNFPY